MKTLFLMMIIMVFVLVPVMAMAQNYAAGGNAPLAQPLVREGTMAVRMVEVLKLGASSDEVEAENILLGVGIAPLNGWISDYPVTPDIVSELRAAVDSAADAGSLKLGKAEAAQAFDGLLTQYNLSVMDDTSGEAADRDQAPMYPDNSEMNDYYYSEGPPPVTYYAPPMDYAYLYSWVPYPFWGWNAWFPGFFVLSDFHRFVFFDRHVFVVSNHFFDRHHHRFGRIDARARFHEFHEKRFDDHGRHFVDKRVVGPSEVRRGADRAFMAEHNRVRSDFDRGRANFSSSREMRSGTRELNRENRNFVSSAGRTSNFSAGRGVSVAAPAERGRRFNSRHVSAPSGSGRTFRPAAGHRDFSPSSGGMRGGGMNSGFGSFGGIGGRHGR
jgi:hypothetical protein